MFIQAGRSLDFRQSSSLKAFSLIMRTVAEKRMILFITPHVDKKHNRMPNRPFLLDKKSFQRVFSSKDRFRVMLINEHFLSKRKLFIFTYGYAIAFNFVMVSPMQSALTAIRCATFSRDVEHRHGQMQSPLADLHSFP